MEKECMALIVPFRGIGYNQEKIGDIRKVVAPPYDVISPEYQETLYQRHPHNVVRLLLNKETPKDTPQDNRYTRSRAFYQGCLKEGVLVRASQPNFYFLREEFSTASGFGVSGDTPLQRRVRQGFIGLIRLEDYEKKIVLPHEKTQTKPRADRLSLMDACQANFSQIFSLYPDEEGAMASVYEKVFSSPQGPAIDLTDEDGMRHTLWMVSDPKIHKQVTEIMAPKKIYIADGHHRYETALAYRAQQCARFPRNKGNETYYFTMMYLAAMEDEGVAILPTHRVVTPLPDFDSSSFLGRLGAIFTVESFPFAAGNEGRVRNCFLQALVPRSAETRSLGMFLAGANQYILLTLKDEKAFDEVAPRLAPSLKALDVNLLHILIFQKLLHIGPQELTAGKHVLYYKDPGEAIDVVQSGKGLMAFFLNPTTVVQVRDVALATETMPSKSTFFYPKLLSGLVINPLDPNDEISVG
jgi:uncharacterized protein (DUF1015 family)